VVEGVDSSQIVRFEAALYRVRIGSRKDSTIFELERIRSLHSKLHVDFLSANERRYRHPGL
jgi:hypothetical protein